MSRYDTDIFVWSERQAALLRRLANGERVNDAVDWPNASGRRRQKCSVGRRCENFPRRCGSKP